MITFLSNSLKNIIYPKLFRKKLNHEEGKICIIGCARSGTKYTSMLFKSYGYALGHEMLERHGICSWCLVPVTTARCWGPSSWDLRSLDLPVVHQVRHPLDVIASLSTEGSSSWSFINKFIPIDSNDSFLVNCMKYWYYWNKLAESKAKLTYRVDDMESVLPALFKIGGFDATRFDTSIVSSFPKNVNARYHASLTIADLEFEDGKLTKEIIDLATRYGFSFE